MFLADYHIHSSCSFDAQDSMADMVVAAAKRGIGHICFTDHSDFGTPETIQFAPDGFRVCEKQAHEYEQALSLAPAGVTLALGLELGECNHAPEEARRVYAIDGYDFIMGSLHNLRNMRDFYYLEYTSEENCERLFDLYLDELVELAALPCYDVMAHLGYCRRYMHLQGFSAAVTMAKNGDKVDAILKSLIEGGRGLELNCADIVVGGRPNALLETFPSKEILLRYRQLGGEIITVGSDSHCVATAGLGIAEGFELLRASGFRYVTLFRGHKPEFVKI